MASCSKPERAPSSRKGKSTLEKIAEKKQQLKLYPRAKKVERIAKHLSCEDSSCQCKSWRSSVTTPADAQSLPSMTDLCRTCQHTLESHVKIIHDLPDEQIDRILLVVYDMDNILLQMKIEKEDQDVRRAYDYLFLFLKKNMLQSKLPSLAGDKVGTPPFEKVSIAKAVTNFVMYKFSSLKQAEWQTMYDLAKMFLYCFNHWKLETPSVHARSCPSDDQRAYKENHVRWVCFCHVPVFCESLHKYDATLIFGRTLLRSVFMVMRHQLLERFTAAQEKMLPEKRALVITHFPRFLNYLEKEIFDVDSPIWRTDYNQTPGASTIASPAGSPTPSPASTGPASNMDKIESQSIRDEALKKGYILLKLITSVMVGSPGVGKTLLKLILLGKKPPPNRSSTICVEQPVKIRSVSLSKFHKYRGRWKKVSAEQLLPMIGRFIRNNVARLRKVIPEEMKEYLELLEVSAVTASDGEASSTTARDGDSSVITSGGDPISSPSKVETEPPSSDEEASALKEMIDSIFGKLEKVIAGDNLSEDEVEELFESIWIFFTDSGGQPQFHELLPLFIRDISSLIFVTRLSDELDDRPPDEFYQDGELVGKRACTHLTTSEQIQCLTRSLLSQSGTSQPSNVIMVGTHRDLSDQCSENIKQKNEKVIKMFGPKLEEHLIFYKHPNDVIFPMNCLNPEEKDEEVAKLIQDAVESTRIKEVNFPIWWFILELLIQGIASKLGKRVLSKKFCVGIAEALGFTERSFDAALSFFDELNVMKYCKALPDLVFPDCQVPVSNLSDVIREGYELSHGQSLARKGEWKQLYTKGIVTVESLSSICKHFEKGLFEAPEFLKLLENHLVVVPLKLSPSAEYFMPALLDILSGKDLNNQRVLSSMAAPLLFRFSHGCRRAGVFCCLVVYLMKECEWSIQSEGGEVMQVARNCITFQLPAPLACFVTLIDAFYYIEAHILKPTHLVCQKACPIIHEEILAGINAACEKLNYISDCPHLAFYCDHSSISGEASATAPSNEDKHAAVVREELSCCTCVNGPGTFELRDEHKVWLTERQQVLSIAGGVDQPMSAFTDTTHSRLDSKPTLAKLSSLEKCNKTKIHVIKKVAPGWYDLGSLMDFDDSGTELEIIRNKYHNNPVPCCRAMFQHWLKGNGCSPTSWRTLIELLKDSGQKVLAREVRSALITEKQ